MFYSIDITSPNETNSSYLNSHPNKIFHLNKSKLIFINQPLKHISQSDQVSPEYNGTLNSPS